MNNFKDLEPTPSFGEQRVRVCFNPSDTQAVDIIKQKSADLIDILQAVRNDEVSKTYRRNSRGKKMH